MQRSSNTTNYVDALIRGLAFSIAHLSTKIYGKNRTLESSLLITHDLA